MRRRLDIQGDTVKAKTCEEYVLQELEAAARKAEVLEDEVRRLNRKLYGSINKAATDAIFNECFKPCLDKGITYAEWCERSVDVPGKYEFDALEFMDFFRPALSNEYKKYSENN